MTGWSCAACERRGARGARWCGWCGAPLVASTDAPSRDDATRSTSRARWGGATAVAVVATVGFAVATGTGASGGGPPADPAVDLPAAIADVDGPGDGTQVDHGPAEGPPLEVTEPVCEEGHDCFRWVVPWDADAWPLRAVVTDGHVLLVDGAGDDAELVALALEDGAQRWRGDVGPATGVGGAAPLGDDHLAVVVDHDPDAEGPAQRVVMVDTGTGEIAWQRPATAAAVTTVGIVVHEDTILRGLDADGRERWQVDADDHGWLSADGDRLLLRGPDGLRTLDPEDGAIAPADPPGDEVEDLSADATTGGPAGRWVLGGYTQAFGVPGSDLLDVTGRRLARVPPSSVPVGADDEVVVVASRGWLFGLDRRD
ncbi:PQQ-binding-like beta-propeller repeat protein [Nitriliruptoraceae bacterium ZYF776]|nr:PQQ-binding-like beta-propeller repeat protein [Profundirhabdus halotolerans]